MKLIKSLRIILTFDIIDNMKTVKNIESVPTIRFSTNLFKISSWTILLLPESASAKLPSRAMVMVKGTINGFSFKAVLEPDGKGGHWFKVDETMSKAAKANAGDIVALAIEVTKEWSEPEVPVDLKNALAATPKAHALWIDITPNARWDWIRWIRFTKQPETRKRRIEVTCSKLKSGMRRPCCFNRNMCTEPSVSNNGVLLGPTK